MSAAKPESSTVASRDAAHASASTSASSATSLPAAAASSAALLLEHELAAVKQRILDVEGDIAKVEKQLAAAIEKRDRFEDDEKKWERHDGDVQRLRTKEEQLRTKEEQLRDELKRKELAQDREVHSRLLTHGFPVLSSAALVNSPSSTPSGSGKHEPAAIAIKELSLLSAGEFQARPVLASQIWAAAAAHAPDPLAWSTECDVQGYVKQALSDCIVSGGLQRQLRLSNELSVDDQRPDVWVLHLGKHEGAALNLPVGVGEVKKPQGRARPHVIASNGALPDLASLSLQSSTPALPAASPTVQSSRLASKAAAAATAAATAASSSSSSADAATVQGVGLDKPTLLGQIFDYMCMLRTQYGLRYVFGIVTNYAEWRIVWLPDSEAAAQATELPFRDVQPADAHTPLRRKLHGTRVHRCGDPLLICQLVSMLHKMAQSPHEPPAQLVDSDRPRCCVSETPPYQWVHLASAFSLKLLQPVHANSKRLLLLQDYRGGADGRVWLVAAESSGALGVIKFPRRHLANRQLLEDEAERWRTVWQADGTFRFLKPDHLRPDQPASYLSDVDASELDQLIAVANADPMAVALEAVEAMAEAQYEHMDVHWRHVAFLLHRHPKTNKLRRQAVLIDLGRVERLSSATPSIKAAAVERMLAALS